MSALLDPGLDPTLRPMRYPAFFDRYKDAIPNTWNVEEIDLHHASPTCTDCRPRSGTSCTASWRSPPATRSWRTTWCSASTPTSTPQEARLYLSRQLFGETVRVQFYLNLREAVLLRRLRLRLLPAPPRAAARARIRHQLGVPRRVDAHRVRLRGHRHRPRGGTGPVRPRHAGTSAGGIRRGGRVRGRLRAGPARRRPRRGRRNADRRLLTPGMPAMYGSRNPFAFLELQDVQVLSNFFERRVCAYQVGVGGSFDEDF